jgi:Flp pilus assembly protein TadD
MQPDEAGRLANGNTTLSPQERQWMELLAFVYLEQGKIEQARTLLRVLRPEAQKSDGVLPALAFSELLLGNPREAARLSARVLNDQETDKKIPLGLIFAKALWNQGQAEAARSFLEQLFPAEEEKHGT